MGEQNLNIRIKHKYDTEANWNKNNPVLLSGEIAITSDKFGKHKVGDGTHKWSELSYVKADLTKSDVISALGYTPPSSDTWRGIQDNLISSSTTESLSAAQGKILKELVDGKAPSSHTHTKSEVGLGNVDNTADATKSVKYATSAGSASSAAALTSNAGSSTQPVYFSGGKPVACSYTLGKSVPADALFTDHTYGNMKGATSSSAGSAGLVPAPNIGEQLKFLRADGAWVIPTNTTYSVGTSSYLGITKLYTETGSATDGTMTQNAITSALNGKSPTSHTHNYAGSSSSGGAANSANKLATARTVSGGTDITLSFNYDGSGNSSANIGFYSSSASVGDKNNYPFHRFAKLDTIAASYSDKSTTFFISQDYSGGGFGIVRIVLRTNDSSLASTVEVKWLVRCGLSADSVQVGIYNVFGKTYADAFFKTGGSYAGTCFRTLASGARGGISRTWVLVNSSEVRGTSATDAKTSTECYATIAAAGTALHKQAYSSIVSGTDSGTASYANSAGSANSVAWGNVTGKPSTFAPSSHTHNYAGSSSAGGAATSANKLSTPRKIGNASFDGTADITLSQMGLNVPVEITKANYLAKKKAGTLNANTYYNVIDEYDSANVINDSSVTANSAFSSTKSEKTYAKKSTLVNTTLTASKWTGSSAPYSYVLSVSGVTSSNIVEIDYASNASSAAIEAYQNAMLADGGQTTNQITIKATEKPTVDIPITIVIRNDL
nr:MAG TPA: hyaluronidase [Herelleviridae sp.]